jgi:hypothetical protein
MLKKQFGCRGIQEIGYLHAAVGCQGLRNFTFVEAAIECKVHCIAVQEIGLGVNGLRGSIDQFATASQRALLTMTLTLDFWNPYLSAAEQQMVLQMFAISEAQRPDKPLRD